MYTRKSQLVHTVLLFTHQKPTEQGGKKEQEEELASHTGYAYVVGKLLALKGFQHG